MEIFAGLAKIFSGGGGGVADVPLVSAEETRSRSVARESGSKKEGAVPAYLIIERRLDNSIHVTAKVISPPSVLINSLKSARQLENSDGQELKPEDLALDLHRSAHGRIQLKVTLEKLPAGIDPATIVLKVSERESE